MIEITFLGQLVATLAGVVAFVSLLFVLAASAYVFAAAAQGLEGLAAPRGVLPEVVAGRARVLRAIATILGVITFAFVIATSTVGGTLGTITFAVALGALSRGGALALSMLAMRTAAKREGARVVQAKALAAARARETAKLEATAKKRLAGEDLRAELSAADDALTRLREALGTLVDTRAALGQKLQTVNGTGETRLAPEVARLRDELTLRIELGERVLAAAEAAAFRLACAMPIKKLVRKRPAEIAGLDPAASGDPEARLAAATAGIDGYLVAIAEARAELEEVATRRPTVPPMAPDADEDDEDDDGRPKDPLAHARADLEVIESAYRSLRERAELTRLGLQAQKGLAAVASAAGVVSKQVQAFGLDERELGLLLDDVARAERVSSIEPPVRDGDLRVLVEALSRGTSALDRDDRASLGGVVAALRSIG
ncbi:hypothetical protein KEG38_40230 [Polyangium jinanense]|uniref:hypothetical protein n=1 Tax=Polyangium jinanense TaxID=2829994 RepID=UPI0023407BE0|nr:hypothetical protein [Polyangium jinanense]MDC3960153.1 hypothetical protein [Polyangium jinanense]